MPFSENTSKANKQYYSSLCCYRQHKPAVTFRRIEILKS